MRSERFDFPNARGENLAALLHRPEGEPVAFALFAHCFTCGKDNLAAKRISEALAGRGYAVLRFDFTGIGASEGEFANTHFSSNVADLVAAADHLRRTERAPALLVGHSLGGAAVLAAAAHIPEALAVATIAAPSDPGHVTGLFKDELAAIRDQGEREVVLAGRPFRIRREFLDDVAEHNLIDHVTSLRRALLVLHSPTDAVVGIDNATRIFLAARHPKSFVSLADSDHLLTHRRDALYAGHVIAAWAERYAETAAQPAAGEDARGVIVSETGEGKFQQRVEIGPHRFLADEPVAAGGLDTGPSPYELLIAGLGACTAMTLRLYADQKSLPLTGVSVTLRHSKIHAADCATCETKEGKLDRIDRTIALEGPLDEAQRARLLVIADKCPVHRTLTSEIEIRSALAE